MKKTLHLFLLGFLILSVFSCAELPSTEKLNKNIKTIYPYQSILFPQEISAPTFKWKCYSKSYDNFRLFFLNSNEEIILSHKTQEFEWQPKTSQWEKIKKASLKNEISVRIYAYKGKEARAYTSYSFSSSTDPIGAPIFYRNVPLPFSYANKNKEMLSWHLGDISLNKSKCVLTGIPVCANCHSFSADGSTLAMDVDYSNDKGNYAIASIKNETKISPDKIISWSDYKREDGDFTFALLSQLSPDGRYVISTVKDRSIFVPVDNLEYSQLFFPFKGILAVYDRQSGNFWSLPGADDPDYVQSNPVWSPDGKTILFARSERYYDPDAEASESAVLGIDFAEEFVSGRQGFKFDIYSVPFNKGKGGEAQPLLGASNNGKSNYFPRYSPDGKWVVFCQSDNFMLLQRDSKLNIIPAEGGVARKMACNTGNMNSWHSFSPNGKWMVFSSKVYGPYTQLLLTHIDTEGNSTPPVLLESLLMNERAANIPEFVNINYHDFNLITDDFTESGNYYLRSATELYMLNERSRSNEYFNKAIELDPNNYETHFLKIRLISKVSEEELNTVLKKINRHLVKNEGDRKAILDRAEVHLKLKQFDKAINDCRWVLKYSPDDSRALNLLATLQTQSGSKEDALITLNNTIEKYPENAAAYSQRGLLFYKNGQISKAIEDAKKAILFDNKNNEYWINLGIYQAQSGNLDEASLCLNTALSIDECFYYALYIKGMIHRQMKDFTKAKNYFTKALSNYDAYVKQNPNSKPIITRSMISAEINRIK